MKNDKWFYHYRNAMYYAEIGRSRDFYLQVNPVLHFQYSQGNSGDRGFINARGAEIRGLLHEKLAFYTSFTENQMAIVGAAQAYEADVPGVGFRKQYQPRLNSIPFAYDFFRARGYVCFSPLPAMQMQFGNDQNFIGNGLESFILSDHAPDMLALKINTNIWKINYLNLFSELNHTERFSGTGGGFTPKYSALHHLSLNLGKNFNLGFFEQIIFARDSFGPQGYKLSYLNPVIFYRAVEHNQNSADNVLVGLDWKWNIRKKIRFYGQFVLDEFKKDEITARNGWWANKWAWQAGLLWINAGGINNLDLQTEFNTARPYTFQHFNAAQTYTHFMQPLGHSAGANFREFRTLLRWQAWPRWKFEAFWLNRLKGMDTQAGDNYGGNIALDYRKRSTSDYQNKILQGRLQLQGIAAVNATWMPAHNLFVDAGFRYNYSNIPVKDAMVYLGVRLNASSQRYNRY